MGKNWEKNVKEGNWDIFSFDFTKQMFAHKNYQLPHMIHMIWVP